MGVSLCLLVRDDAATVGPLLAKLRPHVTEIVVVDTGSIDSSPSICKPYADKWVTYLGCNSAEDEKIEDFANARQYALELASHEWHMWADADDDILGAETIPQLINRPERAVQYLVPYEYTFDAAGRVTCLHWRENLVKPRDQLKWQIPVHEVLIPGCPMDVITPAPSLRRIHKKHLSKKAPDPDRNLRILTKYIARVGETDVRSLYYYGVELRNHGRTGDAIRVLRRYVELSGGPNGWHDERCLAMLELARIYHYLVNDQQEAIHWASEAMLTKSWPEPYFLLARAFWTMAGQGIAEEHNVRRALHWAEHGLRTPDASTVLFVNPMERFEIQHIVNAAHVRHGNIPAALASVQAGLAGMPEDVEFQKRALVYENHLTKNTVLRETQKLRAGAERLMALGAFDQPDWQGFATTVAQLLGIPLPGPTAATAREVPPQPIDDGCLDLVFFLGEAYERWNPVTLAAGGMGGSETMAWELARRLRALGHRVRVFADCAPEQEGVFDGVEWLHFGKYPGTTCDVLIASRRPDVVDDGAGLKAGARWLWIHDVHVSDALTQPRAYRFDRVLALSEWHKAYLLGVYNPNQPALVAHLRPEDITVTRNGIDLSRFEADGPRNPRRVVYSSSPDRGLTTLLEMWPEILEQEPEAELSVYYGFENWEKSVAMGLRTDNPWMAPEALRRIKLQLRTLPRVTHHGRVGQDELALAFLTSGVWAYPTWFCCHGDTRISVPGDHRGGAPTVRMADMVGAAPFPVYSFNEEANRFEIKTCLRVWETKVAQELVEIDLDSGETLRVTPDHRILTFDGDWVEAGTLAAGDSLRALHYRYNVAIRDGNGRWADEHRLVGQWKAGRKLRRDEHVDHSDPIRLDNRPEALTVMTASEHFSKTHKGKKLSKKHVAKKSAIMKATLARQTPEERSLRGKLGGTLAWAKINAMPPEEREAFIRQRVETRKATVSKLREDPAYVAAETERARARGHLSAEAQRREFERDPEGVRAKRKRVNKICNAARWHRDQLPLAAGDDRWGRNHKVVAVRRVTGSWPVYDAEVEGNHNFIADGIVVHNCETYCITAQQAQAAGLYIVTTPVAALNETVADRGVRVPGGWDAPQGPTAAERKAFVDAVVRAIRGEDQPKTRDELQAYARDRFGLDSLAKDWDAMLRETLADVGERVTPRFRP